MILRRSLVKSAVFLLAAIFFFQFPIPVQAACPVCTLTAGSGVMLLRYFGVDDLITGIWLGGLIISLGLWWASSFKRRLFRGQESVITALTWWVMVWGLRQAKFISYSDGKIFNGDRLSAGIIFGSLMFLIGDLTDLILRKYNQSKPGRALFPHQKVILPMISLTLATLIALQCRRF